MAEIKQMENDMLKGLDVAAVTAEPTEDDVIAQTEKAIQDACVGYTNEVLRLATGLVAAGPKAATRGLHLTEGLASLQSEMLRLLGMAKRKRPRRRFGGGMMYSDPINVALGADDEEPETFTGDALGETFGNKALNQLIAIFKPMVQQGGLFGMANKAKGDNIESLTRALAEAKKAKLGDEIVGPIMEKLKLALLPETQGPALLAAPEEPLQPVNPPMFVCGAKEGV